MEAEEALGAPAVPHQRVEGRDQGGRLHPPGGTGRRVGVRRGVPALHPGRRQRALLDQLGQEWPHGADPLAVIIGEVGGGRHAEGPGRLHEQRLAGLGLGDGRPGQDVGGQDPLGKVVDPLEAGPADGGQAPRPVEPLEGQLALAPPPPRAAALAGLAQRRRGEAAPLGHLGQDGLDERRLLGGEAGQPRPRVPGCRPGHSPAHQRVGLHREERLLVRPVLEQGALLVGKPFQHVPRVGAEPGEQRQVVGPHQHVDRVDLEQPDPPQDPAHVAGVDPARRPPVGEPLGGQRHPARLRRREPDHRAPATVSGGGPGAARRTAPARR